VYFLIFSYNEIDLVYVSFVTTVEKELDERKAGQCFGGEVEFGRFFKGEFAG
jgi:hypothetical protein